MLNSALEILNTKQSAKSIENVNSTLEIDKVVSRG
jgi:hypothetical protein